MNEDVNCCLAGWLAHGLVGRAVPRKVFPEKVGRGEDGSLVVPPLIDTSQGHVDLPTVEVGLPTAEVGPPKVHVTKPAR